MKVFLRAVLAAVSLVCAAPPGHGAERVLRIGYVFPQGSQLGVGARRFAAEVDRRTGGAFRIEPYPNSTAGGELEMAEDVRLGHLDMVFITSSSFASLMPDFGIFDIPFLFRDAAHAHAVFDGPIGTTYLARFRQKGLARLIHRAVVCGVFWADGARDRASVLTRVDLDRSVSTGGTGAGLWGHHGPLV